MTQSDVFRKMVELSNNSTMTREAADVVSRMSDEDRNKIATWLRLIEREQQTRITIARNRSNQRF